MGGSDGAHGVTTGRHLAGHRRRRSGAARLLLQFGRRLRRAGNHRGHDRRRPLELRRCQPEGQMRVAPTVEVGHATSALAHPGAKRSSSAERRSCTPTTSGELCFERQAMGKGTAHGPGPFAATHRSPYTPHSIFVHAFTKARGPLKELAYDRDVRPDRLQGSRGPGHARAPLGGKVSDAYDALVIGGGPGGAATAFHLARGGARVLLCEKQSYPREKVCGDGLTPRAVAQLDAMDLRAEYQSWSRSAGLKVHGGGHVIELPWPELTEYPSFGLARPRTDLDQLLARTAEKAGAELRETTEVVAPLVERGLVRGAVLRRDGEDPVDVRAEVVIAADGASSRFAQALGLNRDEQRPIGVAIRQYYRAERDVDPWIDSYLELRRGDDLLPGYGWVFPLADGTVNVGVGLLNTSAHFRNINYKRLLEDWCRRWGRSGASPPPTRSPSRARPRCRWAPAATRPCTAGCCSSATRRGWSTPSTARASTTPWSPASSRRRRRWPCWRAATGPAWPSTARRSSAASGPTSRSAACSCAASATPGS